MNLEEFIKEGKKNLIILNYHNMTNEQMFKKKEELNNKYKSEKDTVILLLSNINVILFKDEKKFMGEINKYVTKK